jgi:alpha-ketoglutarate-dependent taurine dioxygenase
MCFHLKHLTPFGVRLDAKEKQTTISDLDIRTLKQLFSEEKLIVVRGFQTFDNKEDFADFSAGFGEVSIWPFGKVLELIEQDKPADHIFDNNYVPLHWDGMYRPQTPEYQLFHCVKAPLTGQGGRTTFSNTVLALDNASLEEKALWMKVTGIYQRKMAFYHSKTVSPIITEHPQKGFPVIRYNEPPEKEKGAFLNPPLLEFTGIPSEILKQFHQSLKKALYDPRHFYAHSWQTGDIVIADNLSLLHGREAFTSKSPRHIQRVHVLSDPPYDNPDVVSYK